MKRLSSLTDEQTTSSNGSLEEVSKKIRCAGFEEKKESAEKPQANGAESVAKPDPEKVDPGKEAAPAKGEGEENRDAPATDDSAVVEPPAPTKKSEADLAKDPQEYLDPEKLKEEEKLADPEAQKHSDEENQDILKEMGGGTLNDALKGAFSDFLDGKSKKAVSELKGRIDSSKFMK